MPKPTLKFVAINDIDLAYFEWGEARQDAPTLMFVHATGFHARLWDYIIEAFPDHHCLAVDQRGHGRSTSVAAEDWQIFGRDHAALLTHLKLNRMIGISHSMGAHAMVEGAAQTNAYQSLLLLDPTIAEPQAYGATAGMDFGGELHPAAKRRSVFTSVEDMVERLRPKSSFPLYHPRILDDYCRHGLREREDGSFELLCDPKVEARVYMTSRLSPVVHEHVSRLHIPVTIVRAKRPLDTGVIDFSSSPTWPGLVDAFPNAQEHHWADCSHFIPMQRPGDVIKLIKAELERWPHAN